MRTIACYTAISAMHIESWSFVFYFSPNSSWAEWGSKFLIETGFLPSSFRSCVRGSGAKETLAIMISWVPVYWFRRLRNPLPSWFPGFRSIDSGAKETLAVMISWVPVYWFRRLRNALPSWFPGFRFRFRCLRDPLPSWFPGFRSTGSDAKPFAIMISWVPVYWFRRSRYPLLSWFWFRCTGSGT